MVGSLIYIYDNFYSRRNVSNVIEVGKGVLNSNYNIGKLEKAVKFSNTYTNKMNLADAYLHKGRYEDAIQLYESSRNGIYIDNQELISKLAKTYFLNGNFKKTIELFSTFPPSGDDKITFAKALIQDGDSQKAKDILKNMGGRFANFEARITYAHLLISLGRSSESKVVLNDIIEEFDVMSSYEKRFKRATVNDARRLLRSIK